MHDEMLTPALRGAYLALLMLALRTGTECDDGRRWCIGSEGGAHWLAQRLGLLAEDHYTRAMRADDKQKHFREKRHRVDATVAKLPALADDLVAEALAGQNPIAGL